MRIINPRIKNESDIAIGTVLSSFREASRSTIKPFFLNNKKRMIGATKPNSAATKIVTIIFNCSVSNLKANIRKTIKVNDGGTNSVEITRASLSLTKFYIRTLMRGNKEVVSHNITGELPPYDFLRTRDILTIYLQHHYIL